MAVRGEARHVPGCCVDAEHRLLKRVAGSDQQALSVRGPFDGVDRTVEILREGAGPAGREVAKLEHLSVRLVGRPRHCDIGQRLAIRRYGGERVGRVIGIGQVHRGSRSVARHLEDVEVR